MSLKLLKKSLIARPSKSSFISDFDSDHQIDETVNTSILCQFLPSQNYAEDINYEETKQDGNEETLMGHSQSKGSTSDGIDIKLLKADDLGYPGLSIHTKNKIDRILGLYNAKSRTKLMHYFNNLDVFSSRSLGLCGFEKKDVYFSTDFQCFDLMNSSSGAIGFLNGYTTLLCYRNDSQGCKNMLNLTNDCYSAINVLNSPFQNSILMGLFSGTLLFVDLLKEKTIKSFKSYRENMPINMCFQKDTAFYTGNVESCVHIFDYRIKNLVDKLFLNEKPENGNFQPILTLEENNGLLLAGNDKKALIWDLRNLKNSLKKAEFIEKNHRKLNFTHGSAEEFEVIEAIEGNNSLRTWNFGKMKENRVLDLKRKTIRDMHKVNKLNNWVILVDNSKNSEIYCCKFKESAKRKKIKIINHIALDKKYQRITLNQDGSLLGLMDEKELKIIAYKECGIESELKKKLKQIIN